MSTQFVLDCSVAMTWCMQTEATPATEALLDSLTQGSTALVPSLWTWEVNNVLVMAQRSKRLDATRRRQQIAFLQKLPIVVDEDSHSQTWYNTSTLALAHNLTVYDAAYLELAMRQGLPLATMDKRLRDAAKKVDVKCLPAT